MIASYCYTAIFPKNVLLKRQTENHRCGKVLIHILGLLHFRINHQQLCLNNFEGEVGERENQSFQKIFRKYLCSTSMNNKVASEILKLQIPN